MAATPQQYTGTEEKSPARAFWDGLMEKHPTFHGMLSITGSVLGFFLNGHAVVKAGHWVVITAGRIAETALLFATLWITAVNIAPDFITQLAGGAGNVSTLNALSLMAFSLLPEIIVFSAIVITYEHWQRFFRDQRAGNPAWVWGCLYTLPTGTFLIMTVVTLGSFVSRDGATAHITGVAIVIRCLAGWFYALVELIYITLGKRTGYTITQHQVEDRMAEIVATTRTALENTVATLVTETQHRVNEQVANQQEHQTHIDTLAGNIDTLAGQVLPLSTQLETISLSLDTLTTTLSLFERKLAEVDSRLFTVEQNQGASFTELQTSLRTIVVEVREATVREMTSLVEQISQRASVPTLPAPSRPMGSSNGKQGTTKQTAVTQTPRQASIVDSYNGRSSRIDTRKLDHLDSEDVKEVDTQEVDTRKIISLSNSGTTGRNRQVTQAEVIPYILDFIRDQQREPTLSEITNTTGCAKQTAVNSRNSVRETLQQQKERQAAASR